MSSDSHTVAPETAGWTRPSLPPEGEKNFLDDHPFDLVQTPLPDGILVEQARIPMRDGVELAATIFRSEGGDPVPAIATATPYGKDNYQQWHNFRDAPRGNVPGGFSQPRPRRGLRPHPVRGPRPRLLGAQRLCRVLVDLAGLGASGSNPENSPGPDLPVGHHGLAGRAGLVHRQHRHERKLRCCTS